jgi:hypothetical protein
MDVRRKNTDVKWVGFHPLWFLVKQLLLGKKIWHHLTYPLSRSDLQQDDLERLRLEHDVLHDIVGEAVDVEISQAGLVELLTSKVVKRLFPAMTKETTIS